jgi:cytochrome c
VKSGGSGVWGEVMMPPHPQLAEEDAQKMVAYILGLGQRASAPSLPPSGEYTPPAAQSADGQPPQGAVVLRASYTDQGANGLPGATTEKTLVLRAPTIVIATGEVGEGTSKMQVPQFPVAMTMPSKSGSWARLDELDLTGIGAVVITAMVPSQYGAIGGKVEVHADSATGPLLGETEMAQPVAGQNAPPVQLRAALKPATGVHDVYLVFRNDQAKGQQLMMIALTATFVPGSSAGGSAAASTGSR